MQPILTRRTISEGTLFPAALAAIALSRMIFAISMGKPHAIGETSVLWMLTTKPIWTWYRLRRSSIFTMSAGRFARA